MGLTLIRFPLREERDDPLQQRIVELQREVGRLTTERDEALGTLDRLALGIMILDRNMHVTFANASARCLLEESNGPAGQKLGRFFARDPRDQQRLKQLVKSVLQAECISSELHQTNMILHGADGTPILSACVMPASSSCDERSNDKVLLALGRLETAPDLPDCVRQMFSLTDAETKYAIALVRGLSLAEEAEAQGVRVSTARTHLAHIFQKTNTHQQSQLVALLSATTPAFRSARLSGGRASGTSGHA
ncbi:DNA-binding transcriptional regulator, CsgD family [Hyphomicrobiales bacterium]|nr:DNA-binding transcriptional regulator, CsgD family [Hyphomicrobiales bacterium]CAH1698682.1 DNA-binding transcriptional regulator, CsgD family [Hyphomicrobiales bacterium]CAI0342328.1 DNA-binding transcriptional regulator, CsgD family [Hyphomicrobiales bacterium]